MLWVCIIYYSRSVSNSRLSLLWRTCVSYLTENAPQPPSHADAWRTTARLGTPIQPRPWRYLGTPASQVLLLHCFVCNLGDNKIISKLIFSFWNVLHHWLFNPLVYFSVISLICTVQIWLINPNKRAGYPFACHRDKICYDVFLFWYKD